MGKLWKILTQWRRVTSLIKLIEDAYKDKKITGAEAEKVVNQAIETLVEMGIIDKE